MNSGRRRWLLVVALGALSSVAWGCGKDDADLIDEFVQAVTGEVSEPRVDHVLTTYVDLTLEPIDVRAFGDGRVFEASQRDALTERAHTRLSRLYGSSLRVLRKHVDIKGEQANVDLQLVGKDGMGNVRYELRKHNGRWYISGVIVG